MGACILENGDTVILMELMLGGTLFEAIATDRVSWHNRCRPLAFRQLASGHCLGV